MIKKLLLMVTMAAATLGADGPTYSKEVSRLLRERCESCHREGGSAPFALSSYEDVKSRARSIRGAVESGVMPPWKPEPGVNAFRDSLALTAGEKETLFAWLDAGAPEGDQADLPEPAAPVGPWPLGEPNAILAMPKPFEIPGGRDTYRCFSIPFETPGPRWVSAMQIAPGNRDAVHHVLLFLDASGASAALDGKDGKPGYDCFGGPGEGVDEVLGAWAPGFRARHLPDGIGIAVPSAGRIVMQVHYHPHHHAGAHQHGAAEADQTKVGLYFTQQPPKEELFYVGIENDRFAIPAGEKSFEVVAEETIPAFVSLDALVIGPHMHLLGRSIKVEKFAPPPSTESEVLISIKDWDFNWQNFYTFEKRVTLGGSDRLRLTCTYDNSSGNPRNPSHPPKLVTYGEETTDEMCLAFIGVLLPAASSGASMRRF